MEDFLKQYVYSLEMMEKYYLSPYCQISYYENGLLLERKDLGKQFFMPVKDWKVMGCFLKKLSEGLSESLLISELGKLMDEADVHEWLKYVVQGGILE